MAQSDGPDGHLQAPTVAGLGGMLGFVGNVEGSHCSQQFRSRFTRVHFIILLYAMSVISPEAFLLSTGCSWL